MLPRPNNLYTNCHQVDVTQTLLDLQKNVNSRAVGNRIDPKKQKHHASVEINLIDFIDDGAKTPQKSDEINKQKQITDFQHKMLEEFCTTSKAKQNKQKECHRSESSDPLESEYQKFFDQFENKNNIKPLPPVHKLKYEDLRAFEQINEHLGKHHERVLEENACASNLVYDSDMAPKKFIPRLDNEDTELESNKEEDLIEEVMFAKSLEKLRLTGVTPNQDETILRSLFAKMSQTNITHEINTSMDNNKFYITRKHLIENSETDSGTFTETQGTEIINRIKNLEPLINQLEKCSLGPKFAQKEISETNSNNHKDPLLPELMARSIDHTDKFAVKENQTNNLESLVEQLENLYLNKNSYIFSNKILDKMIRNNQIKDSEVKDDKHEEKVGIPELDQFLKPLESYHNHRESDEDPSSCPDREHLKEEIKRNKTPQAKHTATAKTSTDNKNPYYDHNNIFDEIALNNRIQYSKAASGKFCGTIENDTEYQIKNMGSFVEQSQAQEESIRMHSKTYNNPLLVEFNAGSVDYSDEKAARENRIKKLESLVKQLDNHRKLNPDFETEYNPRTNLANDKDPLQAKFKLTQKQLAEKMVTEHDIKYLEAVKKIDKTFQKRSVLKSDYDKLALTPGPGLLKKMVYLPQLMARVEERQRQEKLKDSWNMRPILIAKQLSESSLSNPAKHKIENLTPPETLMLDCNKERLKDFEISRRFNNFVRYNNSS